MSYALLTEPHILFLARGSYNVQSVETPLIQMRACRFESYPDSPSTRHSRLRCLRPKREPNVHTVSTPKTNQEIDLDIIRKECLMAQSSQETMVPISNDNVARFCSQKLLYSTHVCFIEPQCLRAQSLQANDVERYRQSDNSRSLRSHGESHNWWWYSFLSL